MSGAWVATALVGSILSMAICDRVPRQKLIAGGLIACVITLIIECILVARNPVVPGVKPNDAALKGAVAMIFREYRLVHFVRRCLNVSNAAVPI